MSGRLPDARRMHRPGQSGDSSRRNSAEACPLPTRIVLSYLTDLAHFGEITADRVRCLTRLAHSVTKLRFYALSQVIAYVVSLRIPLYRSVSLSVMGSYDLW
jgi:hypothetical protein